MKSVVFFINTLGSGGAEHQLVELANGLVECGYKITISTFGDIEDHYKYNDNIFRHKIAPGKNKIIKMLAIWKYFIALRADWVVGFGQRESRYMLEALLFRSRAKIRAIAGERNTSIGKPTLYERILIDKLYKRADYIIPNSYSQRKYIIEWKPEFKKKTITITNFTDPLIFNPAPLPNNNVLRICVFGRYAPQKNCLRFVEAVRILKTKTKRPFLIEWYGSQHAKCEINSYYKEMKDKVERYDLQNVLVLKDEIKNVAETMLLYDAFCLPSLWEGFSNAISEAICCGKPCIVSDVADNAVMVKDSVNGFLFDPKNKNSIVEAFLKYFALSKEEREAMGIYSRQQAEELFNRERFINSYVELIES